VITTKVSSRYFVGLPIPAGALFLVSSELAKNSPISAVFPFQTDFSRLHLFHSNPDGQSGSLQELQGDSFLKRPLHTFVSVLLLALLFVLYPRQSLFVGIFSMPCLVLSNFFFFVLLSESLRRWVPNPRQEPSPLRDSLL